MNRSILSLTSELLGYLRKRLGLRLCGEELAQVARTLGYKGSKGERRARELAEAEQQAKLARKQGEYALSDVYPVHGSKCAWYWYVSSPCELLHAPRQAA